MEDKNGQEEQAHASRSKDRRRNGQSGPQGSAGRKGRRARQERTARHLQTSRRPQTPAAPDHQASQESPELSFRGGPNISCVPLKKQGARLVACGGSSGSEPGIGAFSESAISGDSRRNTLCSQRIPSWPGVIHSNKGRIHLRRPTCDTLTFLLRRSGGPYILDSP